MLLTQGCKLAKLMDFRLGSVTLQLFLVGSFEFQDVLFPARLYLFSRSEGNMLNALLFFLKVFI